MNNIALINNLIFFLLLTAPLASWSADGFRFYAFEPVRIVNQVEAKSRNYRIALGPYKKRENRWQPEKLMRTAGYVYKETHEIPAGFDEVEIFNYYREQIPETAEQLYLCERRACGESNNWANDHFRVKQLYGINQYQFYSVYQLGASEYIILYVIRRGNRRTYVQLEVVTPISEKGQ